MKNVIKLKQNKGILSVKKISKNMGMMIMYVYKYSKKKLYVREVIKVDFFQKQLKIN